MAQKPDLVLLPREQMDTQICRIDLLMAMYPSEDEISIDAATTKLVDELRDWTSHATEIDTDLTSKIPLMVSFELTLNVEIPEAAQSTDPITLSIEVPLKQDPGSRSLDLPPALKARLRQPSWLNRTQTAQINASLPAEHEEDILGVISYLRDEATKSLATSNSTQPNSSLTTASATQNQASPTSTQTTDPFVRVWFYFPSLSTRTKRNDLVNHAPAYDLTGFVMAGKPGILCLEGASRSIDEYMKFIKTDSWRDIPSHQKKVSERWREDIGGSTGGNSGRVFEGMREITDAEFMGERRGERGNRADLRALEGWLEGLGLHGVFERVFL